MPLSCPTTTTREGLLAYKSWIRGLRTHLALNQTQFGRQFGVTRFTVNRWESDNRAEIPNGPRQKMLKILAQANRFKGVVPQ